MATTSSMSSQALEQNVSERPNENVVKKGCSQAENSPVVWCRMSCCPSPPPLPVAVWCGRACVIYCGRVAHCIKELHVLPLYCPKNEFDYSSQRAGQSVEASTEPQVTSSHVVSGAKARMVASPQQRFPRACKAPR